MYGSASSPQGQQEGQSDEEKAGDEKKNGEASKKDGEVEEGEVVE